MQCIRCMFLRLIGDIFSRHTRACCAFAIAVNTCWGLLLAEQLRALEEACSLLGQTHARHTSTGGVITRVLSAEQLCQLYGAASAEPAAWQNSHKSNR